MPGLRRGLLALACLMPVAAMAAERTVHFTVDGQKVVGTLALPDGVASPPVVLLLHGFTGSRDELEIPAVKEGIFERAARMWSEKGIASLRIDYRGNGESEGKFEDMTMEGLVKDSLAALDFLAAGGEVDKERMSVVGWSMGGAVGSAVAGRTEHDLVSVSLWAPGTNMAAAVTFLLGPDAVKKALGSEEPTAAKLPWGAEIKLRRGFYESLFQFDPAAEITEYEGPLLVAVGTKDDVVFPQPASGQILLDYHDDGPEELWVRPMDHVFNAFQGTETVDELIAKTGDFIAASMK